MLNIHKHKKILWFFLSFCAAFFLFQTTSFAVDGIIEEETQQEETTLDDFEVDAAAAIAFDAESGKIFYKQNIDEPLGIASMTKMLTLYLVLQAVKDGVLQWDTPVSISDHVLELSHDMNLSNVVLNQTDQYTVRDLYEATLIFSANGAAIALAEKIAGSEPAFVDKMREQVSKWGINDATLISASGLNNSDMVGEIYPGSGPEDENTMSARSVAIIAQHLITEFPEILETSKLTTKVFMPNTLSEIEMVNWNHMLPGGSSFKEGVDGLKTGTTDLAGACFTGTMEKDGLRVITVVMNAYNQPNDNDARFAETSRLMDFVYQNWQQKTIDNAGKKLEEYHTFPVVKGKTFEVPVVLGADVSQWVRKDWDTNMQRFEYQIDQKKLEDGKALVAPVKKGQQVGTVSIRLTEDVLGYLDKTKHDSYPLVTNAEVEKAGFFTLMGRSIKDFFSNLF